MFPTITSQMFWPTVMIPNVPVTTPGDLKPTEQEPIEHPECDFCDGKTTGSTYDQECQGKRWAICNAPRCWQAAYSQKDRLYNGLVDCVQTRRDVLEWTDRKNGVKKK